ncbi:PREDICTED: uncharacterized protein LOC109242374 isoform X2 [Nicotiana attenuata]|uniref:uncharacterized protein LOC109242374 isoform X2 n=1 Tax=Nicotiana attenuata TaxID=49451 RepID=UPI0009049146|nr:PREDICTED: uncharacterized protein LOC109242374 isoform X2 [Nicotiana attenuata]XP_019264781.1 PREDICTED: uncharacterized protein LOC109242374 isoform X2 [Nicotiana attenuata]
MALLSFPRFLSPSFSSNPKARPSLCCTSSIMSVKKMKAAGSGAGNKDAAAILWYKHDLRVDDHPGIVAASMHRTLVPLYIFDPRILSRFPDDMLELLLFALKDLKSSLREQGSNLMIRFGTAESIIEGLVKEVKATNIFTEEEVEFGLWRMVEGVKETLDTISFAEGTPKLAIWNRPFYVMKSLKELPKSYDEFKKMKLPTMPPLPPQVLPKGDMSLSWGTLPTLEDLKKFMDDNAGTLGNRWASIEKDSATSELRKDQAATLSTVVQGLREEKFNGIGNSQSDSSLKKIQRKRPVKSAFVTQYGNIVGGGTSLVLNALAAYLRYPEGTSRDEWQEVHEKLRAAETREGASFGALFGSALLLGIISRRRVYYEAIEYEKERNAGIISHFGCSAKMVAAAADTVCSMEWYTLLALKSKAASLGGSSVRIWRWNGYLIHYTQSGDEGPALLLVHGFGAFWSHYRDNIHNIAEGGNRVWALTLLGFGESEKPNIVYTEVVWAKLLRDFIIEVVGEPVHLVGNSIGGYLVAIVACLWPALAKSVILLNSAGNVIPGYSGARHSDVRQTSGAAWLGARFLSLFLRLNLRKIVRSCYPIRSDRADEWLIQEMLRAVSLPLHSFDL